MTLFFWLQGLKTRHSTAIYSRRLICLIDDSRKIYSDYVALHIFRTQSSKLGAIKVFSRRILTKYGNALGLA